MVAKANGLGNPLDNVVMNMPPQVEKFVRKDIMKGLEVKKQLERRNRVGRNKATFHSPAKTNSTKSLISKTTSKDCLVEAVDPIYKV